MNSWTARRSIPLAAAVVAFGWTVQLHAQHAVRRPVDGRPDAVVDLRTSSGAGLVNARWRYSDASITSVSFNAPGPDLRPSGRRISTADISPQAGRARFDDSSWEPIAPEALEARRGSGKLSFGWYRTTVTMPERVGGFETAGSTVVFEIVVDDYAEVWIDGRQPRVLGQTGSGLVGGFNAPTRVVLTTNAIPGQQFQLAVFGVNGPLGEPPSNFIWVRSATLDFYKAGALSGPMIAARVTRVDPAIDTIVPPDPMLEKLADGFLFTEGPVWVPDGYLLFSDPNSNTIYRWSDAEGLSVFRTKSGYASPDIGEYGQPGSNGLALDREGRLTINEHGRRRVSRLEKNGSITVLAEHYQGLRLNSPNDLVYRSDGSLYFTDPPFGLPKFFEDPRKETPFSGIYRWSEAGLTLLARDLTGPNGLAFSPDEKSLYVGNWDEKKKVVMRYDVLADGTLGPGTVFFDMTGAAGEDAIDGVKVDQLGNVYVSGPGGLWVIGPGGQHLGTIDGPEHPHNFTFGGADGRTLYITARSGLYRTRLNVPGIRGLTAPSH